MMRASQTTVARRPGGGTRASTRLTVGIAALALLTGCVGAQPRAASGGSPDTSRAARPPTWSSGAGSATQTPARQPRSAAAAVPAADWRTYHSANNRQGKAAGVRRPRRLSSAWTRRLDAAVYGQPLVVGSLVLVATENNTVYGLNRTNGAVRWSRHLGTPVRLRNLPCGNIDPLGITSTPAYDSGTGSVFVVTETTGARHTLVALRASTGAVRWRRSLDVLANRDRRAEQQRGALAVANGRVYVPFGGLWGDCGNYVGHVTATPVTGRGSTTRYVVPTRREGGIWAPSGVAVSATGSVWVAVGNGASTSGRYDGSDSVLRLAPDLSRRLDFFAPRAWGSHNAADLDLGSTGPLLVSGSRVLVSGKDGRVYLLNSTRLGGIGGQLTSMGGCRGFGGLAYDAALHAAFVPCTSGVLRVDVGSRTLRKRWQARASIQGSPVVGGGAVWTLDASRGTLYALSEASGAAMARASVGGVTRFASPVLTGSLVLVGTRTGVRALRIG
jgi:outer membrane protein assembly factor BamB